MVRSASLHSCYHFRLYKTCVTCILALGPLLLWKLFVNGSSERKSFGTITCRTSAASAFSTDLRDVFLKALYIRTEFYTEHRKG